jgi:NUDIX domain
MDGIASPRNALAPTVAATMIGTSGIRMSTRVESLTDDLLTFRALEPVLRSSRHRLSDHPQPGGRPGASPLALRMKSWLHVGGHAVVGEADPLAIALREAREETGPQDLAPWPDTAQPRIVHVAIDRSRASGPTGARA